MTYPALATLVVMSCARAAAPTIEKRRLLLPADQPMPGGRGGIPAPIPALACAARDATCGVAAAAWISDAVAGQDDPPADPSTLAAHCLPAATVEESQRFLAWRNCVDAGRRPKVSLPAEQRRVPADGWLLWAWSDPVMCQGDAPCDVLVALDLATGAGVRAQRTAAGVTQAQLGRVPVATAQRAALLTMLAPQAQRLRPALEVDIPAGIRSPADAGQELRGRFVKAVVKRTRRAWAWLSSSGEVRARNEPGITLPSPLEGAVSEWQERAGGAISGECPPPGFQVPPLVGLPDRAPSPDLRRDFADSVEAARARICRPRKR